MKGIIKTFILIQFTVQYLNITYTHEFTGLDGKSSCLSKVHEQDRSVSKVKTVVPKLILHITLRHESIRHNIYGNYSRRILTVPVITFLFKML